MLLFIAVLAGYLRTRKKRFNLVSNYSRAIILLLVIFSTSTIAADGTEDFLTDKTLAGPDPTLKPRDIRIISVEELENGFFNITVMNLDKGREANLSGRVALEARISEEKTSNVVFRSKECGNDIGNLAPEGGYGSCMVHIERSADSLGEIEFKLTAEGGNTLARYTCETTYSTGYCKDPS